MLESPKRVVVPPELAIADLAFVPLDFATVCFLECFLAFLPGLDV
jgi:hypothetical protein